MKKTLIILSLFLIVGTGFSVFAADCMQASSIGCFDRFGTFYPNDIKGLTPVPPRPNPQQ
ncbi:hypothetical protein [Cecembia calidifontis]|nr:hypothetical protein [Cecembia calidifontis]